MKKLVIAAAVLFGASQAAGCIFVSGGDDDVIDGGEGTLDVIWHPISNVGFPDCGPYTTVTIVADGSGAPFEDIFDCTDYGGLATNLPVDNYDVWLEFSGGGAPTLITDFVTVGLDRNETIEIDFLNIITAGTQGFMVSWEIVDGATEVGCAGEPFQDGVSVLSTSSVGEPFDDIYDCEDGENPYAVLQSLPTGNYTISVAIIDDFGDSLGTSDAITDSVSPNGYRNLGVIDVYLGE
jgi:hypothetical protein